MENNLGDALAIMVVGMTIVFLILWLVVIIGNTIIRLTNKYIKTPEPVMKQTNIIYSENSKSTIAAIVAAVQIITGGNGHITEIKKV